jgi:hypothetical protein
MLQETFVRCVGTCRDLLWVSHDVYGGCPTTVATLCSGCASPLYSFSKVSDLRSGAFP